MNFTSYSNPINILKRLQVRLQMDGHGKEARSRLQFHPFISAQIRSITIGGMLDGFEYALSMPSFTGCMSRLIINNELQPMTIDDTTSQLIRSVSSVHFYIDKQNCKNQLDIIVYS